MSLFSMDAPQNSPPEAMDCAGEPLGSAIGHGWNWQNCSGCTRSIQQVQDNFEYSLASLLCSTCQELLRAHPFLSHQQQVNLQKQS